MAVLRESKAASGAPSLTFQQFFRRRELRVGVDEYRARNGSFWKEVMVKSSKNKIL